MTDIFITVRHAAVIHRQLLVVVEPQRTPILNQNRTEVHVPISTIPSPSLCPSILNLQKKPVWRLHQGFLGATPNKFI